MHAEKPCTVAFLHPPETSYTAFFRQQHLEMTGTTDASVFNPYLDEWCDEFRGRIAEIGKEEGITTEIHDHQLHEEVIVPGRRARRTLRQEADIITTIDPPQELAAFVLGTVQGEPHMRSILAYSTRDGLEDAYQTLGTAKVPVLITREVRVGLIILLERDTSLRMVPKMFAFLYTNENQRDHAITEALRYPDCRDVEGHWHSFMPETSSPRSE